MTLRIYGNRPLKTLAGQHTRPTAGRVREALFNILQSGILGCRWLDLCAGSGAMGAEALCRGASAVVGIDSSKPACAVVSHNWRQVAQPHQSVQVIRGDVVKQLARLDSSSFDYIYFDPPYESDLYAPVLEAIATSGLLKPGGALIVEHGRNKILPSELSDLRQPGQPLRLYRYRQKTYGRTELSFYSIDESIA